jgi:glucan phosphoethanolaminetransferase (alkaline phosphatase superfamily)
MDEAVTAAVSPEPARRAPRSVKRSLGSIVLGFETIVVFLAALVFYGLGALPPVIALGGGAVLVVVFLATIALLRFPWAYVIGWILQVIMIASGILNPVMFVVGALFGGMWVYSMITGTRIDKQKENA